MEKSGKLIRVLYGSAGSLDKAGKSNKLLGEIKRSFTGEYADMFKNDVTYYVLGLDNFELLEKCGATDIQLIDSRPDIRPARPMVHFYNKSVLLSSAMEDYPEILFTDYDCIPYKRPDDRMWELLRNKGGRFMGSFQCPSVSYKNFVCLSKNAGGVRNPKIHTMRKCLNTCLIYCNDKTWVDAHLIAFDTYPLTKKGNFQFGGGEAVLIRYLDMTYGVMDIQEMTDAFEPDIIELGRGVRSNRWRNLTDYTKSPENIYFKHF